MRARILSGWKTSWIILLQTLILPHRAFARVRDGDYTWLALVVYLVNAVIGVLIVGSLTADPIPLWTVGFHPIEYVGLSVIHDAQPAEPWLYSVVLALRGVPLLTIAGLVVADVLGVLGLSAIVGLAANALMQRRLAFPKWCTAVLLVTAMLSLLALVVSVAAAAGSASIASLAMVPVALPSLDVAILAGYLTLALVVIGRVSIARALSILVLAILLWPVWLIGGVLAVLARLVKRWRHLRWLDASAGLLLTPRRALRLLRDEPLRGTVLAYLACSAAIVVAVLISRQSGFVWWALVFNRVQVLLLVIGLGIPNDPFSTEALAQLRSDPFLAAWLVVGSGAVSIAAIAAVHITMRRVMNADGSLRHLITCFLLIANLGLVGFGIYPTLVAVFGTRTIDPVATRQVDTLIAAVGIWGTGAAIVWSVLMPWFVIAEVYDLSLGRALGAWTVSVVLFVPVAIFMVFGSAAEEFVRPFRVQRRIQELANHRLRTLGALTGPEPASGIHNLDRLIADYGVTSDIARRARQQVSLHDPFRALFMVNPTAALERLGILTAHKDRDVQLEAAATLCGLLEEFPEQVITSYRWLLSNGCANSLLGDVGSLGRSTPPCELAHLLYVLLTEVDASNLLEQLDRAVSVLRGWRDRRHGDELFLVYRALLELRRSVGVLDLERASDALIPPLNVDTPLLAQSVQLLKPLLDICQYLAYYSRAEFENKIPYLAAPMMILVDQGRGLDGQKFPPEDNLFRLLIPHLQDIVLREFSGLRGRADLRFELEPKRAPFDPEVSIVLHVRNQGSAGAEQVQVRLVPNGGADFNAGDVMAGTVELLSPKRETRFEFSVRPREIGRVRVPFEVNYDDLEKKGRSVPFAAILELYDPAAAPQLERTQESLINPYITGLPVKDPNMFFGRADVFRFIRDNLQGRYEKNILVLRGQRRTGKTSILYQLGHRLDEKYVPVILDVQNFASIGVDRFMQWMAWLIARGLRERGFQIIEPKRADFKDDPYATFAQVFLPQVWQTLGYHHLLMAFDEFEELAARVRDGKIDQDVFPFLRSLMQHTDKLDFIFAGTHKLEQITGEYWSILFNIALFKDIGFMGLEDVEQIIRQPVKGTIFYDDLAVAKIARVTAGHPYFVQMFGNKLVNEYLEQGKFYFTLQDVNRVIDEVLVGGALQFDYLWQQSGPVERVLLSAMARLISREDGAATLAEIQRTLARVRLNVTQTELLGAAKSLVVRELVMTDPDFRQFEFKIDLVRLWLDQYQPFGMVAEAYSQTANNGSDARSIALHVPAHNEPQDVGREQA